MSVVHDASSILQQTAIHCNTSFTPDDRKMGIIIIRIVSVIFAVYDAFSTLQHTATHCNTLQHTSFTPDEGELKNRIASVIFAVHDAFNILQHTATHCNTLHSRRMIESWKIMLLDNCTFSPTSPVALCCSVLNESWTANMTDTILMIITISPFFQHTATH